VLNIPSPENPTRGQPDFRGNNAVTGTNYVFKLFWRVDQIWARVPSFASVCTAAVCVVDSASHMQDSVGLCWFFFQ
jgi:hypothetical protein